MNPTVKLLLFGAATGLLTGFVYEKLTGKQGTPIKNMVVGASGAALIMWGFKMAQTQK